MLRLEPNASNVSALGSQTQRPPARPRPEPCSKPRQSSLGKAILWTAYGLFSVQSKKEQPHQADIHHFGGAETQLGGIYSVTVSTVWLNPPDFNNVLICRNQIIPITPNYL